MLGIFKALIGSYIFAFWAPCSIVVVRVKRESGAARNVHRPQRLAGGHSFQRQECPQLASDYRLPESYLASVLSQTLEADDEAASE